jgi:hypothetical protein
MLPVLLTVVRSGRRGVGEEGIEVEIASITTEHCNLLYDILQGGSIFDLFYIFNKRQADNRCAPCKTVKNSKKNFLAQSTFLAELITFKVLHLYGSKNLLPNVSFMDIKRSRI